MEKNKKAKSIVDNLTYERDLLAQGYKYIAGVDEVGRGPLAGNVVCCAVIMDLEKIVEGVTDSKKLSEKRRISLYDDIISASVSVCIAEISPEVIDLINIRNATRQCMCDAIDGLSVTPDIVLSDAEKLDLPMPNLAIIKGDLYSYTIGAASILAKVYRDRQMEGYALEYPDYGFEKHKGYGTKLHIEALQKHGATEIHRKSFIKKLV